MLSFQFAGPVAQTQELPDLAAFVAMFLLGRSVVRLTEVMLRASDGFLNQVPRFCHTQFLLSCAGRTDADAAGAPPFFP